MVLFELSDVEDQPREEQSQVHPEGAARSDKLQHDPVHHEDYFQAALIVCTYAASNYINHISVVLPYSPVHQCNIQCLIRSENGQKIEDENTVLKKAKRKAKESIEPANKFNFQEMPR